MSIFLARPELPADGIPLTVKDLFDIAGLVTTYGSIVFAEHLPLLVARHDGNLHDRVVEVEVEAEGPFRTHSPR